MKDICAFDYDSKPTQPPDCGSMTDKEHEALRIRILESDSFAYYFEDVLTDNITKGIAGVIGYHVGMQNDADLGRFIREVYADDVEKLISRMEGEG